MNATRLFKVKVDNGNTRKLKPKKPVKMAVSGDPYYPTTLQLSSNPIEALKQQAKYSKNLIMNEIAAKINQDTMEYNKEVMLGKNPKKLFFLNNMQEAYLRKLEELYKKDDETSREKIKELTRKYEELKARVDSGTDLGSVAGTELTFGTTPSGSHDMLRRSTGAPVLGGIPETKEKPKVIEEEGSQADPEDVAALEETKTEGDKQDEEELNSPTGATGKKELGDKKGKKLRDIFGKSSDKQVDNLFFLNISRNIGKGARLWKGSTARQKIDTDNAGTIADVDLRFYVANDQVQLSNDKILEECDKLLAGSEGKLNQEQIEYIQFVKSELPKEVKTGDSQEEQIKARKQAIMNESKQLDEEMENINGILDREGTRMSQGEHEGYQLQLDEIFKRKAQLSTELLSLDDELEEGSNAAGVINQGGFGIRKTDEEIQNIKNRLKRIQDELYYAAMRADLVKTRFLKDEKKNLERILDEHNKSPDPVNLVEQGGSGIRKNHKRFTFLGT